MCKALCNQHETMFMTQFYSNFSINKLLTLNIPISCPQFGDRSGGNERIVMVNTVVVIVFSTLEFLILVIEVTGIRACVV